MDPHDYVDFDRMLAELLESGLLIKTEAIKGDLWLVDEKMVKYVVALHNVRIDAKENFIQALIIIRTLMDGWADDHSDPPSLLSSDQDRFITNYMDVLKVLGR